MGDYLTALWLSMQDSAAPDDADDDDDDDDDEHVDDDEGGGLPAPVPPQPSRWPPRIRLFLPPALPAPCPVGV